LCQKGEDISIVKSRKGGGPGVCERLVEEEIH